MREYFRTRADEPIIRIPDNEQTPSLIAATVTGERIPWGVERARRVPHDLSTLGRGVRVAILDTGIDPAHPDLNGAVVARKDFTNSINGANDVNGHGTHCAGVIAARSNGSGIVGVAPDCGLLIGKVLSDKGYGTETAIANGILWAIQQGAHVISMSLGGDGVMPRIAAAIELARDAGIFVVAAAGNSGPGEGTVNYPGKSKDAICVGAIDSSGKVAVFSSRGPELDCVAAGVDVESTYPGGRYAVLSGTSMAVPHVSGVLACIIGDVLAWGKPYDHKVAADEFVNSIEDIQPGQRTAYGRGEVWYDGWTAPAPAPSPIPTPPVSPWSVGSGDLTEGARKAMKDYGIDGFMLALVKGKSLPGGPSEAEIEVAARTILDKCRESVSIAGILPGISAIDWQKVIDLLLPILIEFLKKWLLQGHKG